MNIRTVLLLSLVVSVAIGIAMISATGMLVYEYREVPAKLVKQARQQLLSGPAAPTKKSKPVEAPKPLVVKNPFDTDSAQDARGSDSSSAR